MADQLDGFVAALRAYADNEYCLGIRMAHREDKCLGWEHKAKTGKFGAAEKEAHTKMDMHLGAHYGIHEAIRRALRDRADGVQGNDLPHSSHRPGGITFR